jgi:hypothetical protein
VVAARQALALSRATQMCSEVAASERLLAVHPGAPHPV